MDIWESRVNCTIHKFDDFLGGLEAVSIIGFIKESSDYKIIS